MKNILRKYLVFQSFLNWTRFIFELIIGFERQEVQPSKPYVFVSPATERRSAVERAVRRFELKKQGGAAG